MPIKKRVKIGKVEPKTIQPGKKKFKRVKIRKPVKEISKQDLDAERRQALVDLCGAFQWKYLDAHRRRRLPPQKLEDALLHVLLVHKTGCRTLMGEKDYEEALKALSGDIF